MGLISCPRLGRSLGSLPATPTQLLASPLERSGCETPLSVDSLPLEWDHTGDVGGSSSHEEEEEEDEEEERDYFSALSGRLRAANVPRWGLQLSPGNKSVCISRDLDPGFSSPTAESSPGLVEAADIFVKPSELLQFLIRGNRASFSFSSLSPHSSIQPELDESSCWLKSSIINPVAAFCGGTQFQLLIHH